MMYCCSDTPVLVEYVVLGGVNDQPEHAHQLGQLLSGRKMVPFGPLVVFLRSSPRFSLLAPQTLNLIPYNPSVVPDKLEQPTHDAVSAFREICMKDYKIFTTVRRLRVVVVLWHVVYAWLSRVTGAS
jgi:adenine C2-methylase RlmN of 23S rRNA A2503 and tRNA A37